MFFLLGFGNTLINGCDFIKRLIKVTTGFLIGFINSVLGAGGGMISVPLLKRCGISQNEAHASTIAVIFPLTVISAIMYTYNNHVTIKDALPYVIYGIIGAVIGACILKKISGKWLKRVFGAFMIYAGARMMYK